MMMLGVLPAALTFLIRLFVPESEKWKHEQRAGHTSQWATVDLFGVLVGVLGPALIIYVWVAPFTLPIQVLGSVIGMLIALGGYLYPVIRYLARSNAVDSSLQQQSPLRRMLFGAMLSGVALLGTWGSTQWAPTWSARLVQTAKATEEGAARIQAMGMAGQFPRSFVQIASSIGAIVGTILAALIGDWLGRKVTYFLMCISSLLAVLGFFQFQSEYNMLFVLNSFLLGMITASFYGWLPLYLPELFSTRVRATGQGFSFNFGRIIAAVGALQIGALLNVVGDVKTMAGVQGGYPVVCSFVCGIYLVGMAIIWFGPETKGQPLPE